MTINKRRTVIAKLSKHLKPCWDKIFCSRLLITDAENPVNFRLNNVTTGSGYGGGKSEDSGMFKDGLSWDYLQNMYEAMDNAPDKTPARTFMNSKLEWVDKWPDNEPGEPRYREMNMTRYLVGNRT